MTPDQHAAAVVKFYATLTAGDIPADVAGVCAINFSQAVTSGHVDQPEPTREDKLAERRRSIEERAG